MLLQWCTLEPHGPGNLAAIRFTSPVRIQSISIFPTGSHPFAGNSEIVARTEPQAFYLELYFNVHPVAAPDGQKPKASNALVPTVIAYAGGLMDFTVGMSEHATRLMIVKGAFDAVSLAIYGEVASEAPTTLPTHVPKSFVPTVPVPIPRALDPSNSYDPTQLAQSLLKLIPDAPPLPLIIRLMFCLKPANDDWDLPEFPYLHPDLEQVASDLDVEQVSEYLMRPVADDIKPEVLTQFSEIVAHMVGEKDGDQAYLFAGILSRIASQNPELVKIFLQNVDFMAIFDASTLDEETIGKLLNAAANPDIARHLGCDWFLEILDSVTSSGSSPHGVRAAARHLASRIEAWNLLEDSLTNTQGDFSAAASALVDLTSQEASFGVWLASMVTHQDLTAKLSENPIMLASSQHPPLLLRRTKPATTHDEYITFVRALIGVSCVLVVYAWADSLPEPLCRERILGILRLWQDIDGYREILNHLLMMRQMIFRLECMIDDDVPSKGGLDAEHVLVKLAESPQAIIRPDMTKCILSLKPPHSFITSETRTLLCDAAHIAEDGLERAVDELVRPTDQLSPHSLLRLRVALMVVEKELDEDHEYEVTQEFWRVGNQSMFTCFLEVFSTLVGEIGTYFSVDPPPMSPPGFAAHLFQASQEILRLILRLIPIYPPPGRGSRCLIVDTVNLFIYTDAADMLYSHFSPTCLEAQEARQSCLDLMRMLVELPLASERSGLGALVVLQTVLDHGLHYDARDPSHHLLQVFSLIDCLLPTTTSEVSVITTWMQQVIPSVLRSLWAFLQVLDPETKSHFFRRLVELDDGVTGIGDWLLQEELKGMSRTLHTLAANDNTRLHQNHRLVRQYQLSLSLLFLLDLLESSSSVANWLIPQLTTDEDTMQSFTECLWSLVERNIQSSYLTTIARIVGEHPSSMHSHLRYPLSLILLQGCKDPLTPPSELAPILKTCRELIVSVSPPDLDAERLGSDIGAIFATLEDIPDRLSGDVANELTQLLTWFVTTTLQHKGSTPLLRGITADGLATVCDSIQMLLDPIARADLDASRASLILIDEFNPASNPVPLPANLEFTLHEVEELLLPRDTPAPATPQRKVLNQDVFSLVNISPPTALIRSPIATSTGLTKTYLNNDFRQLRQTPSARQNTSRLPSMHVDDFETASSPTTNVSALPMTLPVAIPSGSPVINVGGVTPLPPPPIMPFMVPELQRLSTFQPMMREMM